MVTDKQDKIRETLKLMSLSTESYGLSYFVFQSIFAVTCSLIVTGPLIGNTLVFGEENALSKSILLMISNIIFNMASIPFAMCMSTMFTDPKVANGIGGILVWIPVILPIQFMQQANWTRYLMYPFMMMFPLNAASVVWTSTVDDPSIPNEKKIIYLEGISVGFAWFCLIAALPAWYLFYVYLEQIMPS